MDADVAPGWHPDPSEQAAFRWWDGQRWTGAVASDPSSPPPPPPPPPASTLAPGAIKLSTGKALVLVGAFLVACGSIGPWAKLRAPLVDETVTVVGTDGDGVATLIGALAIAGLAFVGLRADRWVGAMVVALAVAVGVGFVAVIDIVKVDTRVAGFRTRGVGGGVNASLEAGLWLVMIGAGTAVIGCGLLISSHTSDH